MNSPLMSIILHDFSVNPMTVIIGAYEDRYVEYYYRQSVYLHTKNGLIEHYDDYMGNDAGIYLRLHRWCLGVTHIGMKKMRLLVT